MITIEQAMQPKEMQNMPKMKNLAERDVTSGSKEVSSPDRIDRLVVKTFNLPKKPKIEQVIDLVH